MKTPPFIQRTIRAPRKLLGVLLPLVLFLTGWWLGLRDHDSEREVSAGEHDQVWTCSMHPQIRQPNPGICPICNMDLIPLSGDRTGGLRDLEISDEAAALLDVRVAPVVRAPAGVVLEMFGRIAYDERKVATITSRVSGRLDRLFVDFTGTMVKKGDHLAEIYSPDLLVAQRELILARRALDEMKDGSASEMMRQTRRSLLEATREKLRLLQFTDQQIAEIEKSNAPKDRLTLYAPQGGIVTQKRVNEGQYVKTGDPLFTVADLSRVWLKLEAYESDLQWLRFAQTVTFQVDAVPGKTFEGRISFIDTELDDMRRIASVRVTVENAGLALKPGMFAKATVVSETSADGRVLDPSLKGKWISPMHPEVVKDGPGACDICGMDLVPASELGFIPDADAAEEPLLIPASSVLRTGDRAVVYVRTGTKDGVAFEGREVILGPRAGERYVVVAGVEEGDLVVSRGGFKLDSELQIRAKPSMMNPNAGLGERPANSASNELSGQWSAVPRILYRMIDQPSRDRILTMIHVVEQVDASSLDDEERKHWNEFSRRLLNTLKATSRIEGDFTSADLRPIVKAVEEVGRYMGLPYEPQAPAAVDSEIAAELRSCLAMYRQLSATLAADDPVGAQVKAADLAKLFQGSRIPQSKALAEWATEIAESTELKAQRVPFKLISDQLIRLIRDHGVDAVGDAYVIHCPMAAGGDGADWISDLPEVVNPYYGDLMLSCGYVKDALSVSPQKSESPQPESSR